MADPRHASLEKLRELYRSRAAAFRQELIPYFRYVLQSGFGLLLSAIGITLITGYIRLLNDPGDWPSDIVGTVVLLLIALYAPLRTYFQPADTVFVVPLEKEALAAVVLPKARRAMLASALRMLAAFAVFAPLYSQAAPTAEAAAGRPLPLLGLAFALVGAWNAHAAWNERRLASGAWRVGLRAARFAAVALVAAGLLLRPFVPALAFAVLCAAVLYALARLQTRHALPWDRLIAEEAAARRRWLRFLSWFVDVPSETSRPARRGWIAWTADRLPWRRDSAWTFLYAKTLLRSDTFGAFWRWNAVLIVILAMAKEPLLDAIAFAIAVFVGGLQLTELGRTRFAENAAVVPLRPERRLRAVAGVTRAAGLVAATLLWLAAALPERPLRPGPWLIGLAAALLWTGWLLPRRASRGLDDDEDDD